LVAASFAFTPGLGAWFKARFAVSNATNSMIAIGLQNLNTNAFGATDGIWFQKNGGTTSGNFIVSASSTATTSTQAVTMANNTYIDVGWYYDGGGGINSGELQLFANNGEIGHMSLANLPASSTNLAVTIAVENGTAAGNTLSVDYIMAAMQRDVPSQVLLG